MTTPDEVVASSAEVRARVIEIMRTLDDGQSEVMVPACPQWTVHDVLRHLYGVADDAVAGRLDGVASDSWTAAQIERNQALSVEELCDAWETIGNAFDSGLSMVAEPRNLQAVMDLSTHEHDIRHAIGRPGAQDDASVSIGRQFVQIAFGRRDPDLFAEFDAVGLDDFEVMRTITGRRSARQVSELGLDVERVKQVIDGSPFSLASTEIVERD